MKKVGLIGTHSVGKTTLAKHYSEICNINYLRTDTAKNIGDLLNSNKRLDEFSNQEQMKLQESFLKSSNDVLDSKHDFITDCCSLTCLAYSKVLIDSSYWNNRQHCDFTNRVKESANKYSHIFYLPVETELEDDGFRPKSDNLRYVLDEYILSDLRDYRYTILHGDIERRASTISKVLNGTTDMWDNFISFEGLPGCGKSTQIELVYNRLKSMGYDVHVCKRFGDESLRSYVRELYKNPYDNVDKLLELHIKSFSRQFIENNVEERLLAGQIVLSDRNVHSIIAMNMAIRKPENDFNFGKLMYALKDFKYPGRVVYLDVDENFSTKNRKNDFNILKSDIQFQRIVKNQYNWMYKHYHEVRMVNGNAPINVVTDDILSMLNFNYSFKNARDNALAIESKYLEQGTKPWGINEVILDLQFQIGSLSKLFMQQEGYVHNHGLTKSKIKELISLDMADIISLVLILSSKADIDIDEAFINNLHSDIEKITERSKDNINKKH